MAPCPFRIDLPVDLDLTLELGFMFPAGFELFPVPLGNAGFNLGQGLESMCRVSCSPFPTGLMTSSTLSGTTIHPNVLAQVCVKRNGHRKTSYSYSRI